MSDRDNYRIELSKLKQALNADIVVGHDLDSIQIHGVYASDLMSDLLAYGKPGSILLTGLNTIQAVISSHMVEFNAIAFIRGKIPTDDMKRFAEEKGIVILSSPLDMYEACISIQKIANNTAVCLETRREVSKKGDVNLYSYEFDIDGGDFANAGMVSTELKSIMKTIGYDPQLIRRVVVSTCEGEMNVVMHAKKAHVNFTASDQEIVVVIDDEGKGIPDIELAMQEGYTTATKEQQALGFGAGMGLPNMKRNSDKIEITSRVGEGTRVEMRFLVK